MLKTPKLNLYFSKHSLFFSKSFYSEKYRIGHILLGILLIVFFFGSILTAKASDPSLLTLERIFSSEEFTSERFGPARWLKSGNGYTILEPSETDTLGQDIIRYDPKTGHREIVVPCTRLIPPGDSSSLHIADYEWSQDEQCLLIFTNTKRVWRQNTRGDYWVLDLRNWKLHKLGGDAKPSTLMFAKFSPDGNRVGYVRENNMFVEDLEQNQIIQLTSDGSRTIINGTFDWVYEEEFGLRDGFRWSPDGVSIAYWQLDTEGVPEFYLINNTDSLYPRIISFQYPKVGETNSACRVGVISAQGGKTQWIEVPGDPRKHYIARMEWVANSEDIVFQRLNRLQNTNQLILGSTLNRRARTILTEQDSTWVDVVNDLRWLDNGKRFTWVSQCDGWRHVYLVSRSGKKVRLITPGAYDVIRVVKIDEKYGWLYYMASPENPTQCYLFRARLDGQGKAERLSPLAQQGTHSYQISPCSKWAFHTVSSFDTPPVTDLIRLPQHERVRTLVDNLKLHEKVKALKRQPTEFFRIDIGNGVLLDAWCMKPAEFDPKKHYPLLFFVYGEPAGQTVLDRWRGKIYLWHLMLAQKGYLIMSLDNRGTPAPRGRGWRKIVYRQVGILASADQAAAARAIIANLSYVDPERIGIWGWSGGGSMSLNAIFRYPDLYHTAMAVAPVPDQRLYDSIYQERYMGLPEDNAEAYEHGSPITYAHQLKGNLLIVHGTGDDNVHYQGTAKLINELIKYNKHFTMMAYPNRSHSIYEGENTTRHLYELLTRYLKENLPAGPRLN